jgi:[ribosomal protein S18]-alanine N-acetyltransferase
LDFRLRSSEPEDFETLYEIDQACYEQQIAYSRRELRQYLRMPGAECVVAESEGKILGFCISTHENRLGYIITMDVPERFRRMGIATALIEETERRLAVNWVLEVYLETATNNAPAIALWTKRGYQRRAVRKGYYPGGGDAYTMMKTIGSVE